MPDHDALYHRMFGHPGMVQQLLREFVREPWIADLDFDRMERSNARYYADDDQRREGDVVWRIPLRSGGDAYLLLMLEFQSSPDRWMALRAMVYAGLLWQHIIKERKLAPDGRLPPVFPVVVYNGDPAWAMPVSLDALISLPPESALWQWQPRMRYHIIEESAFSDADLASRDTLAALLFRLENCRQADQVIELMDAVIDWFCRHDGFEALRPLFAALVGRVVEMADGAVPGVQVSENLLEVRTMLATRVAEWKQHWRQEGEQKGRHEGEQRGREEGRQEDEAKVLLRLLERRFGSVPDPVGDRIASADVADLDQWIMRVLDADSIEEVLS
jgi:hypothetical protein